MAHCPMQLPDGFCDQLDAHMHVHLTEVPNDAPVNVIDRTQSYRVTVHIELSAQMKRLICGTWCISVACEGAGTAGEKNVTKQMEMNNCDDGMDECVFDLPGDWFTPSGDGKEGCGDVYNLTVTAIALDKCEGKPLGIAGFCTLGPVMVYN